MTARPLDEDAVIGALIGRAHPNCPTYDDPGECGCDVCQAICDCVIAVRNLPASTAGDPGTCPTCLGDRAHPKMFPWDGTVRCTDAFHAFTAGEARCPTCYDARHVAEMLFLICDKHDGVITDASILAAQRVIQNTKPITEPSVPTRGGEASSGQPSIAGPATPGNQSGEAPLHVAGRGKALLSMLRDVATDKSFKGTNFAARLTQEDCQELVAAYDRAAGGGVVVARGVFPQIGVHSGEGNSAIWYDAPSATRGKLVEVIVRQVKS